MKKSRLLTNIKLPLLFALTYFAAAANVSASIVINIVESGGNVEASYSGSIDLGATTGLFFSGSGSGFSGYVPNSGAIGFTTDTSAQYTIDLSSWTAFGTGGFGNWDTSSGDALDLFANPVLGVPFGYISGTSISGSATKNGSSFVSLGFTPGSYVSTFSNGSNTDSITVNIGAVPVPAAVWLFGSGLLGLVGIARRKKAA